jgi:hypothetical protein
MLDRSKKKYSLNNENDNPKKKVLTKENKGIQGQVLELG